MKKIEKDRARGVVEHAALGIDMFGHERAQWMGVHFVFFQSFCIGGGACLNSAEKGAVNWPRLFSPPCLFSLSQSSLCKHYVIRKAPVIFFSYLRTHWRKCNLML